MIRRLIGALFVVALSLAASSVWATPTPTSTSTATATATATATPTPTPTVTPAVTKTIAVAAKAPAKAAKAKAKKTAADFKLQQTVKFLIMTRAGETKGKGTITALPPPNPGKGANRLSVTDKAGKVFRPYPSQCAPA